MLDSRWWLRLENRVRSFGATGAEPEPDPIRPRDVIHLSIYYCDSKRKWPKNTPWALFLKKHIAKSEGGKTISCHHSRPPGKTRRRYFLTWGQMKQKRTARGHLCVTHELKAKHDLSRDVCMISASKYILAWLRFCSINIGYKKKGGFCLKVTRVRENFDIFSNGGMRRWQFLERIFL